VWDKAIVLGYMRKLEDVSGCAFISKYDTMKKAN